MSFLFHQQKKKKRKETSCAAAGRQETQLRYLLNGDNCIVGSIGSAQPRGGLGRFQRRDTFRAELPAEALYAPQRGTIILAQVHYSESWRGSVSTRATKPRGFCGDLKEVPGRISAVPNHTRGYCEERHRGALCPLLPASLDLKRTAGSLCASAPRTASLELRAGQCAVTV